MELQSSLVVENPIPLDATVWNQSLVYVFRRGWEQAEPSPVHRQVPTPGSSKNRGDNRHQRHGWQQVAPQKEHRVVPRLHTLQVVNESVLHLPLHFGELELLLCPSRLHGSEVLQEVPCQTVMLGHVQNQGQTLQTPRAAE